MSDNHQLTLFQWPAAGHCDSMNFRCVRIGRLLQAKRIPFERRNMILNASSEELASAQFSVLREKSPLIQYGDNLVDGIIEVLDFIENQFPVPNMSPENPNEKAIDHFLSDWADSSFGYWLMYARWKMENNFNAFFDSIQANITYAELQTISKSVRVKLLNNLSSHPVNLLDTVTFNRQLRIKLKYLDDILGSKTYLSNNIKIMNADIAVFSIIQGLFDPTLQFSWNLKGQYNNLQRWYQDVDQQTK